MKISWDPLFWEKESAENYTNNTICILNDEFKFNFLCIPKCASNTIRKEIIHREKLLTNLNEKEKSYKIVAFIRPIEERFWSGVNTVLRRKNQKTKNFIEAINQNNFVNYIIENEDQHLTSVSVLTGRVKNIDWYNIKVIKNLSVNYKSTNDPYVHMYKKEIEKHDFFKLREIKNYYKKDFEIYDKSKNKIYDKNLRKILKINLLFY